MQHKLIKKILHPLGLDKVGKFLLDYGLFEKKDYRSTLFNQEVASFLIRRYYGYHGHQTNSKTANLGYGFLHYSYINLLKPERVLCVGSLKGFIPALCALACKDNHKGTVDFVDAGFAADDENDWGGQGVWQNCNPNQYFKPFGINQHLKLHVMTSAEFAQKFEDRKFEYIYIDADHSYEGVKKDYQTFWPRLTSGGMISFHDINMKGLHHGQEFGVWKLWQELENKNKFSFINGHDSVGFIQKD